MSTYLEHLFTTYGTDKGIWGYTPAYEKYLESIRFKVMNVLEIGICGYRDIPNNVIGASLFAWRDYFPNAHIFGIDNDSRFIFNDQDRIRTICCDAYNSAQLHAAVDHLCRGTRLSFDLIVDDAVHDPFPQLALAGDLAPYLSPGGIYAIEDVCPYKVPGGTLEPMIKLMPRELNHFEEFTTHKDERLIIARR